MSTDLIKMVLTVAGFLLLVWVVLPRLGVPT
jgi:hypothetical protein